MQPPQKKGSSGLAIVLIVLGVLAALGLGSCILLGAGFAILGRERPVEVARPRWQPGQTVDIELTLVPSDRRELSCFSGEELGGKHCAFEAADKPWSNGDSSDDKKLYRPYTTLDRIQFVAAGVWSDPGMAPDKIPATRFNVKCKYKIEGVLKHLGVRWESTGQWYPNVEWFAGSVSDCKLTP